MKLINTSSSEKLFALTGIARDSGLAISMDYISSRDLWILQMFDSQERLVVSANGVSLGDVIDRLHENFLKATSP